MEIHVFERKLATVEPPTHVELAVAQQLRLASVLAVVAQLASKGAAVSLQGPHKLAGPRLPRRWRFLLRPV